MVHAVQEPVGKMLRRAEDAPLFLEGSVLYCPGPDDEDAPAGGKSCFEQG